MFFPHWDDSRRNIITQKSRSTVTDHASCQINYQLLLADTILSYHYVETDLPTQYTSQELSDQLRAVRRTVFILTTPHKPCYVENLVQPHIKLLVAGNLDLALHLTTQDR